MLHVPVSFKVGFIYVQWKEYKGHNELKAYQAILFILCKDLKHLNIAVVHIKDTHIYPLTRLQHMYLNYVNGL